MAHKHIQGKDVNLLIKGSDNTYAVIAASESCDFSITANTADAAAKDDPGNGEWDNSEFQNYSWSASNSSFLVDVAYLQTLLDKVVNGDATVSVKFQVAGANYESNLWKIGDAIITSLEVDASNTDKVKINLSLEGCTPLSSSTETTITPAESIATRIKGKALMISRKVGSAYKTIMCASSHKLSVSIQTSDSSDKDCNDNFAHKEVTGRSISLSSENLIPTNPASSGLGLESVYGMVTAGTSVALAFGYYPASIGAEATSNNWGEPGTVLVAGAFTCNSLSINGQNKQDATFSAEFTGKGKPTVTTVSSQAEG